MLFFFRTAHMWDIWKEIQFKVIDANWRSFQDLKWTRSLDVDKSTFRQQRISLKRIWGLVNLWTWGQLDPLYSILRWRTIKTVSLWSDLITVSSCESEKNDEAREESWGFYPQRGGQMKVIKTHTHTQNTWYLLQIDRFVVPRGSTPVLLWPSRSHCQILPCQRAKMDTNGKQEKNESLAVESGTCTLKTFSIAYI